MKSKPRKTKKKKSSQRKLFIKKTKGQKKNNANFKKVFKKKKNRKNNEKLMLHFSLAFLSEFPTLARFVLPICSLHSVNLFLFSLLSSLFLIQILIEMTLSCLKIFFLKKDLCAIFFLCPHYFDFLSRQSSKRRFDAQIKKNSFLNYKKKTKLCELSQKRIN